MNTVRAMLAIALIAGLAACASTDPQAGLSSAGATVGPIGGDRPVQVFAPASYHRGTPAPLVVLLHGLASTGAEVAQAIDLQAVAEQHGLVYAHPDGTKNPDGQQFWNAIDACCDFYGSGVDDSGYLAGLIKDIEAHYTVDPKRVFLLGYSNGAFMSYRMACDHADLIAAVVSLEGAMVEDITTCRASEPVSVLEVHGTADETVPYGGGPFAVQPGHRVPAATTTVRDWATIDGCTLDPHASAPLDITADDDTSARPPGTETTVSAYDSGCRPGGHAELWTVNGGTHVPALSPNFAPRAVEFLLAHPKA